MADEKRPATTFYMGCPTCGGTGTRHRPRAGAMLGPGSRVSLGTAHISENCEDCGHTGRIPLNSGEWKGRPKGHAA